MIFRKPVFFQYNSGHSDFKPVIVKSDNACEFEKWLYSLSVDEKSSIDYNNVKNLHAEFHKIAGDILQKAISGNKDEAKTKFSFGGNYGMASSKLCIALYDWMKKL
ncbi:MAG: CZB domain-containing protein [Bacteroidetes bacterium]|nr:CZB domain-containing protein [Bacteroidota bacterium]